MAMRDLVKPHSNLASFILRLGLAAVFITHGWIKVSQDNGRGWEAPPTAENFTLLDETKMAVAWGEFVCGIALLVGLLSRLAALGIIVIQMGAITLYTWRYDFVNIRYNHNDPLDIMPGFQYNAALIVMALAVLALGSGKVSVDYVLFGSGRSQSSTH
jgi:putative oxidoreductase